MESFKCLQACNDALLQTGEDLWMQTEFVFRYSSRGTSAVHFQHLAENPQFDEADSVSKINKILTDVDQEVLKRAAHALQVEVKFEKIGDSKTCTGGLMGKQLLGHKVLLSCGQ